MECKEFLLYLCEFTILQRTNDWFVKKFNPLCPCKLIILQRIITSTKRRIMPLCPCELIILQRVKFIFKDCTYGSFSLRHWLRSVQISSFDRLTIQPILCQMAGARRHGRHLLPYSVYSNPPSLGPGISIS